MNAYLRWNNAIVGRLFRPDMAGQPVYLFVTEDLITEVGEPFGDRCADFINAVKLGPPWAKREGLCQRALQALQGWRGRGLDLPPYVAYLALFVLATGVEGFAQQAYYPKLRQLLGDEDVEAGTLPSFDKMLDLWDDLEKWSVRDRDGNVGLFTARIVGGKIHVGLPIAQTILTGPERKCLPYIFSRAHLDPNSLPPESELARALRTHGTGRLRHRTLTLLERRSDDELYSVLLDTVAGELAEWDGSFGDVDDGHDKPRHVIGTARLCLRLDRVSSRVLVTIRCRINTQFPDERLLLHSTALPSPAWCDEFVPGWSTPLVAATTDQAVNGSMMDWTGGSSLAGTSKAVEWQFKFPPRSVRVLVEGTPEGLPGLVEIYEIPTRRPFFLLYSREAWPRLERWVEDECSDFSDCQVNEGFPNGWCLAYVKQAFSDKKVRNAFPWMTLPSRPRVRILGGLRPARGDTFFTFAPPRWMVEGIGADDEVQCQGKTLRPSQDGSYGLPDGMPPDSRIGIEVKRAGQVLARRAIYLTDEFTWRRQSPLGMTDRWGRLLADGQKYPVGMAGAHVSAAGAGVEEFAIPALAVADLRTRSRAMYVIGRAPGQIVRWPTEEMPQEWTAVWIIPVAQRSRALYCGSGIDSSSPSYRPQGDRKRERMWKRVLWYRRKRIAPPEYRSLRLLWRAYQEVARNA